MWLDVCMLIDIGYYDKMIVCRIEWYDDMDVCENMTWDLMIRWIMHMIKDIRGCMYEGDSSHES